MMEKEILEERQTFYYVIYDKKHEKLSYEIIYESGSLSGKKAMITLYYNFTEYYSGAHFKRLYGFWHTESTNTFKYCITRRNKKGEEKRDYKVLDSLQFYLKCKDLKIPKQVLDKYVELCETNEK